MQKSTVGPWEGLTINHQTKTTNHEKTNFNAPISSRRFLLSKLWTGQYQ
jgi:hypothetical protein